MIRKALYRGEVSATVGTVLYTVPPSTRTVVESIAISNNTAGSLTYTIAFATIAFSTTQLIPAKNTVVFTIEQALAAGETITGGASAATSVTFHISGTEEV